jgi:hypothetical protein
LDVEDFLELGGWDLVLCLRPWQALNRRYLKFAARYRLGDEEQWPSN